MATVGEKVTGRVQHQNSDKLKRWVSQTSFQVAAGRRITIVSAYQVVSDIVTPAWNHHNHDSVTATDSFDSAEERLITSTL